MPIQHRVRRLHFKDWMIDEMVGRRKVDKKCIECGKRISGFKDYCTSCHKIILDKIRDSKRGKRRYRKVEGG